MTLAGTGELMWEENTVVSPLQGSSLPVQCDQEPGKGFLASPGENTSFPSRILWHFSKAQCTTEEPLCCSLSPLVRIIWIKTFFYLLGQAESNQKGSWAFALPYHFLSVRAGICWTCSEMVWLLKEMAANSFCSPWALKQMITVSSPVEMLNTASQKRRRKD